MARKRHLAVEPGDPVELERLRTLDLDQLAAIMAIHLAIAHDCQVPMADRDIARIRAAAIERLILSKKSM